MLPADPSRADAAGLAGPDGLDDPARLHAVDRLVAALDDAAGVDRLVRLTALLLNAPVAQVSLLATEQSVVAQKGGDGVSGTSPRADSLCAVTARDNAALAVTDAASDPRVNTLPPVADGSVGAYLGVPLRDSRGLVLGALCVHDPSPRSWSSWQVGVLAELAESVVAELELRAVTGEASRTMARLALALDASETGSFDLDTGTGVLVWDDRLVRLFGYDRATFTESLDAFYARVHPDDVERTLAANAQALETLGELSLEIRIIRPDGEVRWIDTRGRVLPGRGRAAPRLVGVAYDSTEVREARDRVARTLETMSDAFYALDRHWCFTSVNAQAERILGRPRADLLGHSIWDEASVAGPEFREQFERAMATGEPALFEAPSEQGDGWFEVRAWPGPDGLSVYFTDVTGRRRADAERERAVVDRERAYAEAVAANDRLALLADASSRLAASLEPRQVLERLTEIVVPRLGTWVVVALAAETAAVLRGQDPPADLSRLQVVHVAHPDPAQQAALAAVVAALPLSTDDPVGVGAVVRTGAPEWLSHVPPEALAALAPDEATLAAMLALPLDSALTVPLVNRGRALGAMTVAAPAGGPVDRALLVGLAARAAVALDNALLFGAERRTGLTLQRSLLPRDIPAVPGLLSAARYLPGTTGAFVGGDWYQGVRVGEGLVVAMGDVMGHGMRSAARMGQLRAVVATLALEGHGPADLLRRLADSVEVLLDLDLATLLVAAYDGASGSLTIASAGHPPPLLAPLTGPPRYLPVEPGPPLGTFAFPYEQVRVELAPGDTLVLYTDGLVENRGESLDVGLERLRSAVEEIRLPPEQVCQHVLDALERSGGSDDDVALLVLSHLPEQP